MKERRPDPDQVHAKEKRSLHIQWKEMSIPEIKAITAVIGEAWQAIAEFEPYLRDVEAPR